MNLQMLKQKVDLFIKQHHLMHEGATVLVGVSGGPDSMALLHYLHSQKQNWDWRLIVVSIDHSLRGDESKADIDYVAEFCSMHEIPFVPGKVEVNQFKKEKRVGTQEAARQLRYTFFETTMKQYQADYLALGHHGDDQIETMFMRMTRSANPSLLKGIPYKRPFSDGYIVRPFLSVDKQMIEAYCIENEITPRRDPSNQDDIYTRNYFRHHLIPLLKQQNPNLHQSIQRLSESIQADDSYLQQQARQALHEVLTAPMDRSCVRLSINLVKKYPFALQRRMFHLILSYLYHTTPDGLFYAHEQQFLELIHSEQANSKVDLPNGLQIHKAYETIVFQFDQVDQPLFSKLLSVPGQVHLPSGAILRASKIHTGITSQNKHTLLISVDHLENHVPFMVRYRKPGDRMYVKGLGGSKKVKNIFIDKKVPLQERDSWPLVVDQEGHVIWIVGLSKGIIPNQTNSKQYIQLEYIATE